MTILSMHGLIVAVSLMASQNAAPQTTVSLSAETQHIAALIDILPVPHPQVSADIEVAFQGQREMAGVLAASLDTDIAIASVNSEIVELNEELTRLQARSDGRIKSPRIYGSQKAE
jgi:hypothetical protein